MQGNQEHQSRVVFVDMDGVIVNLSVPLVQYLNDYTDLNLSVDDVHIYKLEDLYGVGRSVLDDVFRSYRFWWKAPPYDDGVEAVNLMLDAGFEVYLATTPVHNSGCYLGKMAWVRKHLPRIKEERVIFIHHKGRLAGDFLIDDKPGNLDGFGGVPILINRPWNQEAVNFNHVRASEWDCVLKVMGI